MSSHRVALLVDPALFYPPDFLEWIEFAAELDAKVIAVPPFEEDFLARGHAVHFRAGAQS